MNRPRALLPVSNDGYTLGNAILGAGPVPRGGGGNGRATVLFYCQSSLGIGHTIRGMQIAGGLAQAMDVHFLNGAEEVPELSIPDGVTVVNMPPVKSDAEFTRLQPVGSTATLDKVLAARRDMMLQVFERVLPDVLIIELFPFGRGRFRPELEPLLRRARAQGTRVACSLRDILAPKKDKAAYEQKVVKLMNRYFDLLLIHSDPKFKSLDESFSRLQDIEANIVYTGYVAPSVPAHSMKREPTIIASIGGGRFGHELATAVVRSAPLLAERIPHHIRLYTGPFCPSTVYCGLMAEARGHSNITLRRFTPHMAERLQNAALSISMGGYNTTMTVLATGVRALMMACTNDGGMDQKERVEKLGRMGAISVIQPSDLEPARFADTVVRRLEEDVKPAGIDLDGVRKTTHAVLRVIEGDRAQCEE